MSIFPFTYNLSSSLTPMVRVMNFLCSSLNSLLKNVQYFYQRLQLSRDMMKTVTTQNQLQHFKDFFLQLELMDYGLLWVLLGPNESRFALIWSGRL